MEATRRECFLYWANAPTTKLRIDGWESYSTGEARHYADYLRLAESLADEAHLADRLDYFRGLEAGLVESADTEFRFHSGPVGTRH